MALITSLRCHLKNPALTHNQRVEACCQLAKELEDVGAYEAARGAMAEFWPRVGERPCLDELDQRTKAEVLLRAGVLTEKLGCTDQIEGSQGMAKALINESISIFRSLPYGKRASEARIDLSVCYWREGAYDMARDTLQNLLTQLEIDNEQKARALLMTAIVERSATRYNDALRILTNATPLFKKLNGHLIKGAYHNELALVFGNLATSENREDYLDRAFAEYTAASFHFNRAGHMPYRALVENNLGFLFFKVQKLKEAHKHLDHARRIFFNLKDRGSVAQVDETRAQVLLAEGQYAEAEKVANAAVRALEKGGQQMLLVEALSTYGRALVRLSQYDRARVIFQRAVDVAVQADALSHAGEAAITMIEELGERLSLAEMLDLYERADQWLASSQDLETLQRLLRVFKQVLNASRRVNEIEETDSDALDLLDSEYVFGKGRQRSEAYLIHQALVKAEGSITQAARLLGITHQRLAYILQTRHRDLLAARTPAKRRRRHNIELSAFAITH